MARFARVVAIGLPHHITQRGNYRQNIFNCDADRKAYLGLLKQYSSLHQLRLLGYCLMTNHVHLIAIPGRDGSLARALGRTHCRYAQYLNARQHCAGHLWQNRFFSTVLDEVHVVTAMCYVEQNPVRAGIVRDAWHYPWSSASAHVGGRDETGMIDLGFWALRFDPEEWRERLCAGEDSGVLEEIREGTITGRPLGGKDFLTELGRQLGRALERRAVGRPRKVRAEGAVVQGKLFA
jgi:putative transposase